MRTTYVLLKRLHLTTANFYLAVGDIVNFDPANGNRLTVYRNGEIVKVTTHTVIGMQALSRSTPDGSVLGAATNNLVILPSVMKSMPFDVAKDLTPIAIVGAIPLVLVVNAARKALMSRVGGWPNWRWYSRVNWDALS